MEVSKQYELMVDAYRPKIVWTNGPFRGGEHDKSIFMSALCAKIPEGKLIITDRVYRSKDAPETNKKLSLPNLSDSKELNNFKARQKSRHEGLNGKLKKYQALDATYHHPHASHGFIFDAICTMVQYAMDHGSPIFDA
jgi:hypothetical protein